MFFSVCRRDEIFKRSTISLGVVAALLLIFCMVSCLCCLKKRGEVYLLRNAHGIDNHHSHLRNSDENIPQSAPERGQAEYQFDREEDRETCAYLQVWAAHEQIRLRTINTPGVHVPHAQYLPNTQMENEML